jgi:transcriptional regulator with XRE-family HTH domain
VSQGDLAERVGLTQSAISRIESGERSVESLELAKLAKALDVSVLDLLEERPLMEELLLAARAKVSESAGLVVHQATFAVLTTARSFASSTL